MASPALVSTKTLCPREVSSRTAAGIMPTRYSLFLISLGTPIFMSVSVHRAEHRAHAVDHAADLAFARDQRWDQHDGVAADAHNKALIEECALQRLVAAPSRSIGNSFHLDRRGEADASDVEHMGRTFQSMNRIA